MSFENDKIYNSVAAAKSRVAGVNQVRDGVADGTVKLVVLASDADKPVRDKVGSMCRLKRVKLIEADSKLRLGQAAGIDVSCAAVGIIEFDKDNVLS